MTARDELEAALAERWDDDNLAVYGDHLQAEGDPRGELIAIDRAIDRTLATDDPATPEQRLSDHDDATLAIDRRREHLAAWLGPSLARQLHHHGSARFGFIDLEVDDRASERFYQDLIESPARAYLRRLRVIGIDVIARVLERLAAAPNPWLQDLVIFQRPGGLHPVAISTRLGDRVIAATPRLHAIHLRGRSLFDELPHPHMRTLSIQGFDALGSLTGDGPALPALQQLDFAFFDDAGHEGPLSDQRVAALLPAARLPALRGLDLSRNEPSGVMVIRRGDVNYGGAADPFRFVLDLAPSLANRLVRLAMPAVRTRQQEQALSNALARMPALEHLEIPHGYRIFARPSELHHPAATISVARPWPWPPLDRLVHHDRIQLVELLPTGRQLSLVTLAAQLEAGWDRLAAEARPRWEAFWDTFEPLLGGAPAVIASTRIIVEAFATLLQWRDLPEWNVVFSVLRTEATPRTLTVRRAP